MIVVGPNRITNSCTLQVGEQRFAVRAETYACPLAAFLAWKDIFSEAIDLVAATTQQMQIFLAAAIFADDQVVT